jgi:hypothetical protein
MTAIDYLKEFGWPFWPPILIFLMALPFAGFIYRKTQAERYRHAFIVLSSLPFLLGLLGFTINLARIHHWVANSAIGFSADAFFREAIRSVKLLTFGTIQTVVLLVIGIFLYLVRRPIP